MNQETTPASSPHPRDGFSGTAVLPIPGESVKTGRMYLFVVILAILHAFVGCVRLPLLQPTHETLPATLPTHYGLIGVRLGAAAPDSVQVLAILPRSPAAAAGLRAGDLLVAADNYRLPSPREASRYLRSLPPGAWTQLRLERDGRSLSVRCRVSSIRDLYFTMSEEGRQAAAVAPRHRAWSEEEDALESSILELSANLDQVATIHRLEDAFAHEFERFGADARLQDVHFALNHPLKTAQVGDSLATWAERATSTLDHLVLAAERLDVALPPAPPQPEDNAQDLKSRLLATYIPAVELAESAFHRLDSAARDTLYQGLLPLLDSYREGRYLSLDDTTSYEGHVRTIQLAKRVELGTLLRATALLARLSSPDELGLIEALARRAGTAPTTALPPQFRGDFHLAELTEWGWVLVGGSADNHYGLNAAIIIDLGGDDLYLNNCGAPVATHENGQRRQAGLVGLVIDIAGDDRYLGNGPGSIGGGLAGVGVLIDLDGDDVYQSGHLAQGAALCGVGLLRDEAGNDRYLAQSAAQGFAFWGAGLLLDEAGDDLFSSTLLSQAFGGPRGYGLLRDGGGDDRYLADGLVPSTYGTRDIFQGWSQGVGAGVRGASSGGIGLLVDLSGRDLYQAGNFSQGTGYFFGLGALVDRAGSDRYLGSRYVQGTAAHQAAGVLIDAAGNDRYVGNPAAAQGAGWDAAVGIVEDRSGNDHYTGADLAQGAAAMNGFGLLYDWNGDDTYQAFSGQAHGGSITYWGGRDAENVGVLMDGGGADTYSDTTKVEGAASAAKGVGLFVDR